MNPLAPYLLYLKLGLFAILLAVLAFAGYKVNSWHQDSLHMASVEAQAKSDVEKARQAVESMKAQYAASQKASEGFQSEIESIRNRPVPAGPVRLCRAAPSVPQSSQAASGPSPAVPASGVLPGPTGSDLEQGPDIGPELRELAKEADTVSAKGRAIQGLTPSN